MVSGVSEGASSPTVRDAYAQAGVDITAGNRAVDRYREVTSGWRHPLQLGGIGGFSGLFALPGDEQRVLVASTDGVGTKILLAARHRMYDSVGADLVNHCVNDILVTRATPLFFLDYLAVGRLDPEVAARLVAGVQRACQAHRMALLGGETAEMPGLYAADDFDLAGTIVGMVDRARLPDPGQVVPGDAILGLPAIGLHTNGYSLARSVFAESEWGQPLPGDPQQRTVIEALLAEHPSYWEEITLLDSVVPIRTMAHITGGGLLENLPRSLPASVTAELDAQCWPVPAICSEIVRRAGLDEHDRYRILNMGIGYIVIVPAGDVPRALATLPQARLIGEIVAREEDAPQVRIRRP